MKKLILLSIAVLSMSASALAQYSVTATITDTPDGQAWIGGTYNVTFDPTTAIPTVPPGTVTVFNGVLDGTGSFAVTLPSITSTGAPWKFTLCPQASPAPNASTSCVAIKNILVSASGSLSATLNPYVKSPRFAASPNAYGYRDSEANTPSAPGGPGYFNVISSTSRQWNGTAWQAWGSGGGGATTPATLLLLKGNGSANGVAAAGASDVTGLIDGATYGGINLFGDSITQGTGSSTFMTSGSTARAYAYQLLADFSGNGANYGFGGDQAADMSYKVVKAISPTAARNFITTMMISTNDANTYGTNTNQQDTFTRALEESIAWAAVPDIAKTMAIGSSCAYTGTWATDTGPGASLGKYSVTAGSIATCTVTTYGNELYIGYVKSDGWGTGSATVTIDGATPSNDASVLSYGQGGSAILTANGNHNALALARYAVAAGTHTVVLTTANTSVFEFFWLGGPDPASAGTISPPAVLVGGTPWNQTGGSGVPAPATTAAYNTLIQNAVIALAGDGLNVQFVNVRSFTNGTTDYTGQTLANGYVCPASTALPYHPGDCGHDHLAQGFRASMNMFPNGQFNRPVPALAIASSGGGAVPGAGFSWAFNGNNQDGSRLGLAANGSNEYVDVPSGGTVSVRVAGSIVATFDATGCSAGCGAGGLPTGLAYSGGVLTSTVATGNPGFSINNTTSSGTSASYALSSAMTGYDTYQIVHWGIGEGAGLAGTFTLYDPTAGHLIWTTNPNGDFCLGTPITNVIVCTGAGFIYTRSTQSLAVVGTVSAATVSATFTIGSELEGGTVVGGNYPFLVGTGGNIFSQQLTAATSGANQSGHNVELEASYWTGSASATDTWFVQNVLGTGSNPTSTLTLTHIGSSGATAVALPAVTATTYSTTTNCSSSAAPAVCAAASAGSVVVAAAGTTVTVNTTAVTANSQIFVQEDSSLGTKLSVTCNVTPATAPPTISARTAATSFTITTTTPTTNPRCFSYHIVN